MQLVPYAILTVSRIWVIHALITAGSLLVGLIPKMIKLLSLGYFKRINKNA